MQLNRPFSTVTPTLDGDVLRVLAGHDAAFTTGRVHRVLDSHSIEGVRKVLQRLNGQGVVRSERVGNTYTYRLNRDHLAAEHIIGLARLRETLLERIAKRLGEWAFPPVYAAVFGSAATGSMSVESDLDLLLIRPRATDADEWAAQVEALVTDATNWVGNDTRVLEFTDAEVEATGRDEPVLGDVLANGLTVAGDRAWLLKQLSAPKT
ncbi:nucleotidyltransferase domain-containing protein [Amycolatopsis sp. cg5]|uniref:nucleotidyltransferase domain-containing protein n=1 Tax=Amycolatopsis sp. cg5 TaxID=3238802 RepID=UPI0035233843